MKLMALDGNNIINRAMYGIRQLTNSEGMPTNAIYGFLNILLKLMEEEKPEGIVVAFDTSAPTFRHKKFEGYKATRKKMPEELAVQIPVMKDILDAMGIVRLEAEGWEADDILGALAKKAEETGNICLVVSGDRDNLQLASKSSPVRLVSSKMGASTDKTYTGEIFREEYGFAPEKLCDLKGLMGDSSDNIPGVAGVGEKTAKALMQEYEGLEEIYANLENIKESTRKKLEAGRDMAFFSRELATINKNAPVPEVFSEMLVKEPDNDRLYALLERLEFTKLIERLGAKKPEEKANEAVERPKAEMVAPTELMKRALGKSAVCVLSEKLEALCALIDGEYLAAFETDEGYEELLRGFFGQEVKKTGHDIKSLMRRLLERGIAPAGFEFDTALGAYLLEPTLSDYALDKCAFRELKLALDGEEPELFGSLGDRSAAAKALAERCRAVSLLRCSEEPKLRESGLEELLHAVELPLCLVLAKMESVGFMVDRAALVEFGKTLSQRISEVTKDIYQLAGEEFNINSTKKLGEILFDKLNLPVIKKTKTGYSTNIEVLEKLYDRHPVIPMVIEYRQLTKLFGTYAEGLVKVIGPDGRIHTSFNMTATATGRLSSTEPNLQNIPIRQDLGSGIRKMFVPREGWLLVDADYSQIELRVLAHISGDEVMRNAFRTGEDIHRITASQVFGVPASQVTAQMRSRAKAVNFGIVYGISDFSLAQDIKVSRAEAKRYMDAYLEKYSGVRQYMEDIVKSAKRDGCVTSLFGRRRNLPEISSSNFNLRSFGERVALNTPIQATAADIIKIAMINTDRRLEREGLRARLVLQVHDELIVETPPEEAERVSKLLVEEMEAAASLSIPLTADAHSGYNWLEAKA